MRIRTVPALLAAALLTVAACGGGDDREGAAVDARSYFDDYQEIEDEDVYQSAGAPDMVSGGAVPATTVVPAPLPPGPLEDNIFVDVGDSTFVATADDAESTFALDVDTGSFTVAQAFLDEGTRPDPDAIRTEEWVNAFDYGDPAPTDGEARCRSSRPARRRAPTTARGWCASVSPPPSWPPTNVPRPTSRS